MKVSTEALVCGLVVGVAMYALARWTFVGPVVVGVAGFLARVLP